VVLPAALRWITCHSWGQIGPPRWGQFQAP